MISVVYMFTNIAHQYLVIYHIIYIGIDFKVKSLQISGKRVKIQIWLVQVIHIFLFFSANEPYTIQCTVQMLSYN